MVLLRFWITFEVLGVSRRYLRGMYPRFTSFFHMLPPRSDAPPTQNGPKTDLRVRSKMAKSRFFCYFSCCGPSGACYMAQTFHMESSYSIGIFSWKKFFSTHLPSKNFCAWKFSKISLEKIFDQRNPGYGGAAARQVFAHKTPSYSSSNQQNIVLIS